MSTEKQSQTIDFRKTNMGFLNLVTLPEICIRANSTVIPIFRLSDKERLFPDVDMKSLPFNLLYHFCF